MVELEKIMQLLINNILTGKTLLAILIIIGQIIMVLILGKYLLKFLNFLIDQFLKDNPSKNRYTNQRNHTLRVVAKNGSQYLIYFVGATIILEILGVPTTSVLAGAGVVGLAVGFGAQSLVKDIITGFFILFENQFTVGDYVQTSNVEGIVEEVGLRITKIKNFDGDLHIIPNGNIDQVTNLTTSSRRALVDVPIDYDQNIQEAINVLEKLCADLKEEYSDVITEGPQVLGVQELAASSVNIRVIAMVEAMESWKMNRIIKQRIKERFEAAGIKIPFNHLTIIQEE